MGNEVRSWETSRASFGVEGTQILSEDLRSGLEEFKCTVDVSTFGGNFELAGVSSLRYLVFCRSQGSW